MAEFLDVDPRNLRLPPSRQSGADPFKLAMQKARHGSSTQGMPPILVTRGKDDLLMINDGVTRATRVAELLPGQTVVVEVAEIKPHWDLNKLPLVGDRIP